MVSKASFVLAAGGFLLVATVAPSPGNAPQGGGNVQRGQKLFAQCIACHSGRGTLGPSLAGVVGRKAGSRADFAYSPAMQRAGFIWTEPKLQAFLRNPRAVVPGNRMAYGGLPTDQDARDLTAYLVTRQ